MWTYLVILISLSVIVFVFARRLVLHSRRRASADPVKVAVENTNAPEEPEAVDVSRKDKDRTEALCKKGVNLIKIGKEEDAIKCFVQALALNELHNETQHRLAVLYLKKQMYGAAAALFKRLVESSEDPVYYSHLGLALYKQSNLEEAKSAYQKAVELDPKRAARFVSLAQVYRAMGQLEHSLIALDKALEIEKENMDFLLLLASIQVELKNNKEALDVLEKILEINPENKDAASMLKDLKKITS